MGDGLQIKDKRFKSSSSLATCNELGVTHSGWKLDTKELLPEVEDKFNLADARCDDLQQKLDLVKNLKRKKKLKKRSVTRLIEPSPSETVPFIRIQPKRKATQSSRLRTLVPPRNLTRGYGYVSPTNDEQQHIIDQVSCYSSQIDKKNTMKKVKAPAALDQVGRPRISRRLPNVAVAASGDNYSPQPSVRRSRAAIIDEEQLVDSFYENDNFRRSQEDISAYASNQDERWSANQEKRPAAPIVTSYKKGLQSHRSPPIIEDMPLLIPVCNIQKEQSVVELFNKKRNDSSTSVMKTRRDSIQDMDSKFHQTQTSNINMHDSPTLQQLQEDKSKIARTQRWPKMIAQNHRYEKPTVASQMKRSGCSIDSRCGYLNTTFNNIPFVASKSTGPSHNIGVNIQQVLNGLKLQQPLNCIPLTMAHHMGLSQMPKDYPNNLLNQDNCEINTIKLGQKLLRLPSNKMSYNRLLCLYRQGEGIVPRFLRAMNRTHSLYTSMYNLSTSECDVKPNLKINESEAKKSLREYANLYREYELLEEQVNEGGGADLERQRDEVARELATREDHIRNVVQEYKGRSNIHKASSRETASSAVTH